MLDTFYEGLATVLAWFYDLTHSYGLSIILLTLAVRLLVTPLTIKGTRSMMAMQAFQPEIKRLQAEFKGDRQRLNEEMLKFYKENNINPMGSCLPLLIQLPVFFVLYHVIRGLTHKGADGLFDPKYVGDDTALHTSLSKVDKMLFLGVDLARSAADMLRDSFVQALPYLAIIAVVTATSYIQQKQVAGRNPAAMSNPMQKNLMRVMPLMFAFFSFSFPAALGIYFVTSNLWQVAQQWYISRHLYGIRKGQRPEPVGGVITVDEVKKDAKPKPTKDRPAAPGARGASRTPAKAPAKPRPTSGRVTEPKRPRDAQGGNRPAPGRRTGGAASSNGKGANAKGDGSGGGDSGRRRRVPFGSNESPGTDGPPPGGAKPDDPKKRRS
jgi:YidC/Oxa1 family membrane protein insertase